MIGIDSIIKTLRDTGVQYKSLGEIGELIRGNGMPKTDFTASGVGAIHYGQIYTYYGTWTSKTISSVAPETAARLAKVQPGDIIITNTSENLADVGKAVAWLGNSQIVTGGHATVFKHSQNAKFIAYLFQTPDFYTQKKKLASGTKVIDLSASALEKIRIPVPPIEIQHEIVRILDAYNELQTELKTKMKAELEARRSQYSHYREVLFAFDQGKGVKRVPLGDLGEFSRGRRFTKNDYVKQGIPAIHYGEIYTHYGVTTFETASYVRRELAVQLRYAKTGDVVFAGVGETVEDVGKAVAWLGEGEAAIHDDCFLFRSSLLPKFVSYYTQTNTFNSDKAKYVTRAKMKRLSGDNLNKILGL